MLNDDEAKKIVKVAASVLIDAILDIIQGDSHSWSNRPCQTCRTISSIIGKPFGCYKYQEERRIVKEREPQKQSKR